MPKDYNSTDFKILMAKDLGDTNRHSVKQKLGLIATKLYSE